MINAFKEAVKKDFALPVTTSRVQQVAQNAGQRIFLRTEEVKYSESEGLLTIPDLILLAGKPEKW